MASDDYARGYRDARDAVLALLRSENKCQCYAKVGELRVPHTTHYADTDIQLLKHRIDEIQARLALLEKEK